MFFYYFAVYHSLETGFKMRLMGLGKAKEVKRLNDEMAVELGADMLGEVVVYSVAAFTVFLEYRRQKRKEEKAEDAQNTKLDDLEIAVIDLALEVEEQKTQIREMSRLLHLKDLPKKIVDPKSGAVLVVDKNK